MDDHLSITRPDQLQALADPTRWRILGMLLLDGPATVQELARALSSAKGTVAHHIRVLYSAGLIRIADTRRVRGVVEKRYARVARQFRLDEAEGEAFAGVTDAAVTHLPLRQAAAEARRTQGDPATDPSTSVVVRARMPVERARRFAELVKALAAEFADGAPDEGETFGFVGGVYVPDWAGSRSAGR